MHEPLSEAFIINTVNAFGAKLVENWNCFMEAESGRAVKCAAPDRLLTTPRGLNYITLGRNEDDSKWHWDWHHNLMNLYQVASVHIISILPPNSYDSIKILNSFKNLHIQANLFSTGHPTITVIFKQEVAHVHKWARGAMDNASDYGSEDSRFASWRARNILTLAQICPNNTLARVPALGLVHSLGKPGSATTGNSDLTRMHSSRMPTIRSSSHLSRGEGSASVHAGIPTPQDQAPPLGADPPRDQAPPPRGQTHTCKNITFATSLRTIITK